MAKAVFQLEPLACPSCIKKIETVLNNTTGVISAKVLFHASKVKTEYNSSIIGGDGLEQTISKLGYSVLSANY
ncbi:heavy-metal-associated domain-containing protein [Niallia sp. NCCP-28]|uniref:heavy-metal-associated domain-containing protein n=1 Tax=Niallia sp. NCCP-28 TaxID=2934712 RepID=UPI0020893D14|nr:heavy-metal-associated domain-containing protein [Niallia sp. NCCP-28]GKU83561.1 copper chaperone [Niallia sp. NCCP-28]